MPDAVPTPKTKRLHAIGRTLVLSLLATSLVATAYAEDSDVPSLAGKRIAISMTGTSHYFDIKAFQAQVDEVKRLGGTPITLDAGRNDKNLVNQLQTVVTQKPDAVIQTLGTLSVIDPWLKRISKAGIPLFTIDAPSQYSLNNTTSDNVATGKALAGQLIKDAGGQGNVLVFNGFYGVPVCAIRYDQLKLALKDHPQLKIIEPELRDVIPNTVQDAYSQVSALLNKYPKGSVSAIWAAWDIPQLGASKALIDAGENRNQDLRGRRHAGSARADAPRRLAGGGRGCPAACIDRQDRGAERRPLPGRAARSAKGDPSAHLADHGRQSAGCAKAQRR